MQTRRHSVIETLVNTGSGFVLAALAQQFIITPLFALQTSAVQNLWITVFFTVLSLARSYIVRRFFNSHFQRFVGFLERIFTRA